MARHVTNTHQRELAADVTTLAPLLPLLGGPDDKLWPSPQWAPMILDRPGVIGAEGGHGSIRYRLVAASPHTARFRFHSMPGFDGHHTLTLDPAGPGCVRVRHELDLTVRGVMRPMFRFVIAPLHDACVEDFLDRAELAACGRIAQPSRWSSKVCLLRRLSDLRLVERVHLAAAPELPRCKQRGALVDAFGAPMRRGLSRDPRIWASAIFRESPPWGRTAMAARNAVVALVGIGRGTRESFAIRRETTAPDAGGTVVVGEDASHLRFRAAVVVTDETVTVAATAVPVNARGRLYLAAIRRLHPIVIRSMMRHAHRILRARAASQ